MGPWTRDPILSQFWKLGFCSIRECKIFAHRGQLCKFLNLELVARVTTWNVPKHACTTHQNPFFMHSWNSMPLVGIQHVSLKAYRRWDSMCHILMTMTQIDEPLNPLDSRHRDSTRGGCIISVNGQGILF